MTTLARKELRSLLPFLLLLAFFVALDWTYRLATEFPDQYSLARLFNDAKQNDTLILLFIIAFAMGMGLLVREQDDRTLDFLDALPVTRTRIFLTKFGLALIALWLLPLSDLLLALSCQVLSRSSLDSGLHMGLLATTTGLEMMMATVYLSVGLAFGFLRRFAFLLLGVLFWLYVLLRELNLGWVALANPFTIADAVYTGQRWLFPWSHCLAQLTVGAVCFGIAWWGFLAIGDPTRRMVQAILRIPGVAVLPAGAIVAIVFVWVGLGFYYTMREDDDLDAAVVYPSWGNVRASTRHYAFTYPANMAGSVQPLIDHADAIEEEVRSFLGAEPAGPFFVDMTSILPRHAGQAYWKTIRMSVVPGQDVDEVKSILGHETTHIYIDQLSDSRLYEEFNSTRFFHEGLASYLEYRLFLSPEKLDRLRRVAAVTWARKYVDMEVLVDDERFSAKYDTDLVYPLGEMFVAALVQLHGDQAPGQVLRAMGRSTAPRGLTGMELWQDTFQACGFNFSSVTEAFYSLLDKTAQKEQALLESSPRLRGSVTYSGRWIEVRPTAAGIDINRIVCRFRPKADTPDRLYREGLLIEGAFCVPRFRFTERSFWYQLGWHSAQAAHAIYEPWVEVRQGD